MPQADGTLEKQNGKDVIRFERMLAHPIDRVWTAITEPRELIGWWGDAEVELSEGGRFTMRWLNTDDEGNRVTMHATITELDPPRLIEVSGDPHGVLRFELTPQGDATRLVFSSTLELPDEFRTKVLAGWHFHLDTLAETLDGGQVDLKELPGWEQVHEEYMAQAS